MKKRIVPILFIIFSIPFSALPQTLSTEKYVEIELSALNLNVQRMQLNLFARQNGQLEDGSLQSVEELYQSYGVTVSKVLKFKKYHQHEIDAWYEQHTDDADVRSNLLSAMDQLADQLEALATGSQP